LINSLEDKKGEDIILMDIHEVAAFTDYFVIGTGTSDRMLDALGDAMLETARNTYKLHGRKEGRPSDGWLLIDFGDIIVHLFSPDQRDYYQLEKLWDHGKVLLRLQ
jgi:ribosome-associated protein